MTGLRSPARAWSLRSTFEVVPPNLYRVCAGKNQLRWYAEDDLLVAPGADVQREVRLYSRQVRVTLLTHDGKPAPEGTALRWTSALGSGYFGTATTDRAGIAVFDPAPALPADVRRTQRLTRASGVVGAKDGPPRGPGRIRPMVGE